MQDGFIKSFVADAAFTGCELTAFGTGDAHATPATDPTKPLVGVADTLAVRAGSMVDVQMTQIASVRAGATIVPGQRLMTDATSRAVPAVKQAGATIYTIGIAQVGAVVGDTFPALINLGAIDG